MSAVVSIRCIIHMMEASRTRLIGVLHEIELELLNQEHERILEWIRLDRLCANQILVQPFHCRGGARCREVRCLIGAIRVELEFRAADIECCHRGMLFYVWGDFLKTSSSVALRPGHLKWVSRVGFLGGGPWSPQGLCGLARELLLHCCCLLLFTPYLHDFPPFPLGMKNFGDCCQNCAFSDERCWGLFRLRAYVQQQCVQTLVPLRFPEGSPT